MAHAISFKPAPTDPHQELMKLVEAAPKQHAEALLVAWDLLQASHDQGILELLQGLIGGKNIIAGKIAEGAALPESVSAIRNGIAMARVFGTLDADMLQKFAKSLSQAAEGRLEEEKQAAIHGGPDKKPTKAPTLWHITKQIFSEDGRRGIGFAIGLLTALGRATRD